jgi:Flp pilus assembly protein TadD
VARPDAAADKLAQAMTLHRQGQLDEARRLYRSVLGRQPANVDALHFMGVLLHRLGQN